MHYDRNHNKIISVFMRITRNILSFICFSLAFTCFSQQDSVELFDLAAIMVQPEDTSVNSSTNTPLDFKLSVFTKVKNVDSLAAVYLKLGTAPDLSEFTADSLTVQFHNGSLCMDAASNGSHYPFWNDATSYYTSVPFTQGSNVKWLTIWARHKNGHLCSKKYFKLF